MSLFDPDHLFSLFWSWTNDLFLKHSFFLYKNKRDRNLSLRILATIYSCKTELEVPKQQSLVSSKHAVNDWCYY